MCICVHFRAFTIQFGIDKAVNTQRHGTRAPTLTCICPSRTITHLYALFVLASGVFFRKTFGVSVSLSLMSSDDISRYCHSLFFRSLLNVESSLVSELSSRLVPSREIFIVMRFVRQRTFVVCCTLFAYRFPAFIRLPLTLNLGMIDWQCHKI